MTVAAVVPEGSARIRALIDALEPSRVRLAGRDAALIEDQITIAQIAAPTGDEGARARFMAERFRSAGLEQVSIDDAGNVLGWRPGTSDDGPVVVCAHIDTVFAAEQPLHVRHENGRIIGPGIGDNARGVATIAHLAVEFARFLTPRRPILFACTTGEEGLGDLRGARHLFDTAGRNARAALAVDGAGDERIVTRALGSRRYRIAYDGPGGHSWAAFGAPNAVHAVSTLASRLAMLQLETRKASRSALTVSRIGGGTALNAIPANAWIEVDVRSTSGDELSRLDAAVRAAVTEVLVEENGRRRDGTAALVCTVTPLGTRPAGEVADDDPLVQAAVAVTEALGGTPEMTIASTDANIPISLGIPAVAIGAGGRGGDTHTPNEWFENSEGTRGVFRALALIAAAAGI